MDPSGLGNYSKIGLFSNSFGKVRFIQGFPLIIYDFDILRKEQNTNQKIPISTSIPKGAFQYYLETI